MRPTTLFRADLGVVCVLLGLAWPAGRGTAQVFDVVHAQGAVEGTFFMPHGEFDPSPGIPFAQRPTARYGLRTDLTLSPVKIPWLLAWADLRFYFGDTRPQNNYSYSAKGLAANLTWGVGIRVAKSPDVQIRWAQGQWVDLGGLVWGDRLPWRGVQVRWSFDTH